MIYTYDPDFQKSWIFYNGKKDLSTSILVNSHLLTVSS